VFGATLLNKIRYNNDTASEGLRKKMAKKKTEVSQNGATARRPSEQALQLVDVAVGAVPVAAENVRRTVEQLLDSEARSQELETLQHRVSNLRDEATRPAQVETLKQKWNGEVEKAQTRGGEVRRQVTDQLVARARQARERVEPVYRDRVEPVYRERVEPVVKERVEPVYRERVEPVYRERVEPTVKRVRERI
jgi:hypothetical protein